MVFFVIVKPGWRNILRGVGLVVFGILLVLHFKGWSPYRQPVDDDSAPDETGVVEAPPDPSLANLRLRITINGRQGFINGCGQMVIAPQLSMALPFSDGLAAIGSRDPKTHEISWRFVNVSGVVVFANTFEGTRIGMFHEGLAPVRIGNKWGYIDTAGRLVVPPTYDNVDDFSEGVAAVTLDDHYGVIDRRGNLVVPCTKDSIGPCRDGRMMFVQNSQCGFLDARGQVAVAPQYDDASDFSEGLAFVAKGGRGGYIDPTGRHVISDQPLHGGDFHQGLAAVQSSQGCYFIDTTGKAAVRPAGATELGSFCDGLAPAMIGGSYGFVDRGGTVAITPQWQAVSGFSQGVCKVISPGVRGYINVHGQYIWKQLVGG